ncbi:MAG: lytic transglycosylase domain-containing protein, partial [Bacteroidota bacterium]|nr:lytic transglycosylase domain-containing protein [Bacteroidota bacterium]
GLKRQLEIQKSTNYYDLRLNQETSRYVFRILALKEIMENPNKYGFQFRKQDLYKPIPTYTVEVDSSVGSWADFSKKHGINYKILKLHNPWLIDSHLTNSSRIPFQIKIPQENIYKIN